MKGIRTFSAGRACAVTLSLTMGLTCCCPGQAQHGVIARPELAVSRGENPSEGEAKYVTVPPNYQVLMIAPEDSVVHLVGQPQPPAPPDFMTGVNVWIEAVFIQMERGISRDFEKSIGFKLSPPDGKALLDAEEKEIILAAVDKTEKARIIASVSCFTVPGQQTQTGHVQEFTYPTEYKAQGDTIVPGNWRERDVGVILNVTATAQEREEGRLIRLVLLPEVTALCGWKKLDDSDFGQPVFTTFNITATVTIPDGSTFVMKQAPVASPFVSQAVDSEGATNPENQVTLLLLVSAKLVPYE